MGEEGKGKKFTAWANIQGQSPAQAESCPPAMVMVMAMNTRDVISRTSVVGSTVICRPEPAL